MLPDRELMRPCGENLLMVQKTVTNAEWHQSMNMRHPARKMRFENAGTTRNNDKKKLQIRTPW